jgi:uncharacterized membrane protein
MAYLAAFGAAALVFLVLDALWLGIIAKNFYFTRLNGLLRDKPDLGVAAIFYAGYLAGVVYFAVAPALQDGGLVRAVIAGALLGLFAYGTYDLTNLATLKNYPVSVAIVDMIWGMLLTAATAGAGYWAATKFHS